MKQLLYFSAPWCQPCRQLKPIMEQISNAYPVEIVDVENSPLSQKYNIRSVPTVILLKNGQELRRFIGLKTFDQITNFIGND